MSEAADRRVGQELSHLGHGLAAQVSVPPVTHIIRQATPFYRALVRLADVAAGVSVPPLARVIRQAMPRRRVLVAACSICALGAFGAALVLVPDIPNGSIGPSRLWAERAEGLDSTSQSGAFPLIMPRFSNDQVPQDLSWQPSAKPAAVKPAAAKPAAAKPAAAKPAAAKLAPVTLAAATSAPVTPTPVTPTPVTPALPTPSPIPPAPAPPSPAPVTPAPVTPAPVTPAPPTPALPTPAPATLDPVKQVPALPRPRTLSTTLPLSTAPAKIVSTSSTTQGAPATLNAPIIPPSSSPTVAGMVQFIKDGTTDRGSAFVTEATEVRWLQ